MRYHSFRVPQYCGQNYATLPDTVERSRRFAYDTEQATKDAPKARVVLRQRTPQYIPGLAPYFYATVTESFRPYDPDQLGSDLLDIVRKDESLEHCRATVAYRGTSTTVRLIARDTQGLGHVCARIDTADDTSQSVKITGEIWIGRSVFRMSRKVIDNINHSGRENRFKSRIRAAIRKVPELVGPFVDMWRERSTVVVADLDKAVNTLVGNVKVKKGDKKTRPWLKIASVDPKYLAERITKAFVDLCCTNPNITPNQASLALVINEAGTANAWSTDKCQDALTDAANALLEMSPKAFLRTIGESSKEAPNVDPMNIQLATQLEARHVANKWFDRANAAKAAGDHEAAKACRERAELILIEGDVIEQA
jgi:hypothetical protein